MSRVYARRGKLWLDFVDAKGKRRRIPSGLELGHEQEARELLDEAEREATRVRLAANATAPITSKSGSVRAFALGSWIDKRRELDVDWKNDKGRLEHYVLPVIGDMPLDGVRAKHIADLFHRIRTTPAITTGQIPAQRSVYNIYSVVSALFRDAALEGLIDKSPCILTDRQLGPLVDADAEWRAGAVFTRDEARALISDVRIPPDRRLYYGLGLLAGLRPGEIAALRWSHYDATVQPLGKLVIAYAHNTRKNKTKSTKTNSTRIVPVHPTLAAMLAEWKLSGWAEMAGRPPTSEDLIVPLPPAAADLRRSREGDPIRTGDYAGKCWREHDLKTLAWRDRELYATKSTFITLAIEDGANPDIIRDRVTHTKSRRDAFTGYDRGPHWIATCAEVAKLVLTRTSDVSAELKIAAAGTNVAPPENSESNPVVSWRRWESNPRPKMLQTELLRV